MDVIGSPFYLTASAQIDSAPLWAKWADDLLGIAQASTSERELLIHLTGWQERAAEDRGIADSIYRTTLHAHMAGQLFVREIEVPEVHVKLDSARLPPFLKQAFEEAVESFRRRQIVSPAEWERLSSEARRRSFSGTGFASEAVAQRVHDLLLRHLREGGSFESFRQEVRAQQLGITSDHPAYLETVYRTSVQSAYGAGRLRQLESPAVVQARPWVQYRTAQDSRVRPTHALLDGKFFDRRNDSEWRKYAPPNGFSCRCSVVAVREDQVDPAHVISSSDPPSIEVGGKTIVAVPDVGWEDPPDFGLSPQPEPA